MVTELPDTDVSLTSDPEHDTTVQVSSTTPLIDSVPHARKLHVIQRFRYAFTLYLVKFFIGIGLRLLSLHRICDTSIQPTFTRVYPCRPALKNRIFIPKSHTAGDLALPLYIDIHGGGFALMSPIVDDKFCSDFSNNNNVLVVSLDYPKSPTHRFPVAVEALIDLVYAVLEDGSLPIERTKVAIGGFSAGGNLACAVSQDKRLQGKIGGVVTFYAPVNFATKMADKMETLPRNSGSALPQDHLTMFHWAYVKEGQDLTDPILSPTYARRESLPPKICIIGCELDLLCRESEIMAEKMANNGTEQRAGSDLVWERNGVRWEKVVGEDHAFDARIAFGAAQKRMRERGRKLHESVAEWLFREVYI